MFYNHDSVIKTRLNAYNPTKNNNFTTGLSQTFKESTCTTFTKSLLSSSCTVLFNTLKFQVSHLIGKAITNTDTYIQL